MSRVTLNPKGEGRGTCPLLELFPKKIKMACLGSKSTGKCEIVRARGRVNHHWKICPPPSLGPSPTCRSSFRCVSICILKRMRKNKANHDPYRDMRRFQGQNSKKLIVKMRKYLGAFYPPRFFSFTFLHFIAFLLCLSHKTMHNGILLKPAGEGSLGMWWAIFGG